MMRSHLLLGMILLSISVFGHTAEASELNMQNAKILYEMEAETKEMVDVLLAKDQVKSLTLYKSLSSNLRQLGNRAVQQPFNEHLSRERVMVYSWMRLIAIDLKHSNWVGAAIAANQINGEIIRFTDFANLTLRDLAWMEYLGREVLLLTMDDPVVNEEMIDFREQNLNAIWQRVRGALMKKDFRNKTLVMKGDRLMQGLTEKKKANVIIRLAKDELRFILSIEKNAH